MGIAGVPFTKLPKIIVVELVYATIFWYSITIPEDYISITLGLGAIILGRTYDYNMLCGEGLKFGEYVQTHEKTTTTMRTRTVSTICLCPSGNTYGSFYYYSLWPGRCLHRRRRTPLPMSQEIIDRVHYIADKQKNTPELAFTRQDGTSYEPEGHDESIQEDNLVNSTQPAEIKEANMEDDDEAIDDDVEVLLVPSIEEPRTIEGGNEDVTNENEHETTESEGVYQVNTESE